MALSCCRLNTRPTLNLKQKMESTKPTSNEAESGNKSKPLLCDGFLQDNLIIEVRKKDLVALYNFAYELAKKASKKKVNELKEIDLLFSSKGKN